MSIHDLKLYLRVLATDTVRLLSTMITELYDQPFFSLDYLTDLLDRTISVDRKNVVRCLQHCIQLRDITWSSIETCRG